MKTSMHSSAAKMAKPMLAGAIAAGAFLASSHAEATPTAGIQAIAEWGDCGSASDARPEWDDMCISWWAQMNRNGYALGFPNLQGGVTVDWFDDKASWGADDSGPFGLDSNNAAMVCTHGGHSSAGWSGQMHHRSHNECYADASQMSVGPQSGGRLQFLHLSSCNSAHYGEWNPWKKAAQGGTHLITGFHGYMYIGNQFVDDYASMALGGVQMGVGIAWQAYMKATKVWPWEVTTCPVSLGFGENVNVAANRVIAERYNYYLPNSPAGHNGDYVYALYPSGCTNEGAQFPLP